MSTYEEFMVLLTFAILVVAILDYVNHKNSTTAGAFQIDTIGLWYTHPHKASIS